MHQVFVAAEAAVAVGVEAVEQRPAVAELLAGEARRPGWSPSSELVGQGRAVAVLGGADVAVAVVVEDVEGAPLALPLRPGDAAVAVAVLGVRSGRRAGRSQTRR